jgi:hypothetical protein
MQHFLVSIEPGKSPINGFTQVIAPSLPRLDFRHQPGLGGNAWIDTLFFQNTNLNLRHI